MVRNGRLADFKSLPEFPDAEPGASLDVTAVPLAASGQPEENNETVGMGQGLERIREFLSAHTSIDIDISLDCQATSMKGKGFASLKKWLLMGGPGPSTALRSAQDDGGLEQWNCADKDVLKCSLGTRGKEGQSPGFR
jgi:hypothetical protein